MNSGVSIKDLRKKSPKSALRKRLPLAASEIVLFIMSLVSSNDAAG